MVDALVHSLTKNKEVYKCCNEICTGKTEPAILMHKILGEAAVDLPDNYFDTTKAEYKLRRDTIVKRLNAICLVYFVQTLAVLFMPWLSLPIDDS